MPFRGSCLSVSAAFTCSISLFSALLAAHTAPAPPLLPLFRLLLLHSQTVKCQTLSEETSRAVLCKETELLRSHSPAAFSTSGAWALYDHWCWGPMKAPLTRGTVHTNSGLTLARIKPCVKPNVCHENTSEPRHGSRPGAPGRRNTSGKQEPNPSYSRISRRWALTHPGPPLSTIPG